MKLKAIIFIATVLLAGCQTAPHKTAQKSSSSQGKGFLYTQQKTTVISTVNPEIDFWGYVQNGMKMNLPDNDRIREQEQIYLNKKSYLHDVTLRAEPYMYWIINQIDERNMPMELVLLPIVESAFNPHATSPAQAAGLWQIMPKTGQASGLRQNQWVDDRRDIAASTEAALDLLERLNTMFGGDWALTLAAYNSGEGRVLKAMEANAAAGKSTDYWSLSLPKETMQYVPKLFALSKVIRNSDINGIKLPDLDADRALTRINIGQQISLDIAAKLLDIPVAELRDYNPSLKRGITSPSGPHYLMLPKEKVNQMMLALSNTTTLDDIRIAAARNNSQRNTNTAKATATVNSRNSATTKYKIRNGDSLYSIAQRHKMTVRELQKLNGLKTTSIIKPGQTVSVKNSKNSTMTAPKSKAQPRIQKYKVRQGDSYYSIAQRHGIKLNDLMSWNQNIKMADLHPGVELTLKNSSRG